MHTARFVCVCVVVMAGDGDHVFAQVKHLKPDFTAADVNEFARETCKNWFHKASPQEKDDVHI
jgi:hypothetical protein